MHCFWQLHTGDSEICKHGLLYQQQRTYSTQLFYNVPSVLHMCLAMQPHNLASEGHLHCPCSQVDS